MGSHVRVSFVSQDEKNNKPPIFPDDGGRRSFRNVGTYLATHNVSHLRRPSNECFLN